MRKSLARKIPNPKGESESISGRQSVEDCAAESLLIGSLRVAVAVASGRRASLGEENIADLTQNVALRLWKWLGKHREKSDRMSEKDWDSFTARSAHNEINRHFRSRSKSQEVPLEEATSVTKVEAGHDAGIEVVSLIRKVWQEICMFSVKQRRALILHSPELVIYFMQAGITAEELAAVLEISRIEWNRVCDRLPLTDLEIAELMPGYDSRGTRSAAKAVKKARFDARKKLDKLRK